MEITLANTSVSGSCTSQTGVKSASGFSSFPSDIAAKSTRKKGQIMVYHIETGLHTQDHVG